MVTISTYDKFLDKLGKGDVELDTGTHFRCALLNGGHTFAYDTSTWASISGDEVTAQSATPTASGAYADDGATMTIGWTSAANSSFQFDASNVTWNASATLSASHAVIWASLAGGTKIPCFFIDFEGVKQADTGTKFIIEWAASGIFELSAT